MKKICLLLTICLLRANNEYKVTLGSNKTHNYYAQCFTDPNDSIRRHAYCFVWFKDATNYHCYYYHIYGVKPAMFDVYKAGIGQMRTEKQTTRVVVEHTHALSQMAKWCLRRHTTPTAISCMLSRYRKYCQLRWR